MNRNEKFINAWKIVQKIAILDVPKIQVQINKPDTRAGVAELVLESGHVREVLSKPQPQINSTLT